MLAACGACGGWSDSPRRSTEILWSDPEARLVADTIVNDGFPDATLSYTLRLEHVGRPPIDVDVSTVQGQQLHVQGTRLANHHVAWIAKGVLVCEELAYGSISCNDFSDLGCRIHPGEARCCLAHTPDIGCTCGTPSADPATAESLAWASRQMINSRTRAGIAYALARLGRREDATRALEAVGDSDQARIWRDATRVLLGRDPAALRARYRSGSQCDREVIARACPACPRS